MLQDIKYPSSLRYKSNTENEPRLFFLEHFYHSNHLRFHLGFFSTKVFKTLSSGFAHFITSGGSIQLVINHFLTKEDKEFLSKAENIILSDDLDDIEVIKILLDNLDQDGKHFEKCLSYLIQQKRIVIKIIKPKNSNGYEHTKEGVFNDGEEDVYFSGSANFTASALLSNSENINVDPGWLGEDRKYKIKEFKKEFDDIWSGECMNYHYLSPSDAEEISNHINKKYPLLEAEDILKESLITGREVSKNSKIEEVTKRIDFEIQGSLGYPRFPYIDGPRDYQKEALDCWITNGYQGIFAMATGTGKTITSLNCLLHLYRNTGSYLAIILVPSKALLDQWIDEVSQFNFKNIIAIGGGHGGIKQLPNFVSNHKAGLRKDLIIISTYASFSTPKFQNYFKQIQDDFLLIADEAHNMGASQIKKVISRLTIPKRIGLSATPKRKYDPEGTDAICEFFNDTPPFCYSFGMRRAMEEGRLTNYYYYPRIVTLDDDEKEEYVELSNTLLRYFDFETGQFKESPIVERLLLRRKAIIHQARQKIPAYKEILRELDVKDKLKYVFTYVPVGRSREEEVDQQDISSKFVYQYLKASHEVKSDLKLSTYTSDTEDRKSKIRGFSEGKIDMLLAMKMLDEGVDIPRTEVGIFASSTGNPREYIQRRGRLLRNHDDKKFAYVYDMIVAPVASHDSENLYRIEKNMVRNELIRVGYFASLSMNFYDSKDALQNICDRYELDLDMIVNELEND